MIDAKVKDLINRDIDGVLSGDEKRRLGQAMRRNTQARRLHEELSRLTSALEAIPQADPPAHLANRIRAAVHAGEALPAPRRRAWRDLLGTLIHPSLPLRYASVFAGGLAVGVLLFALFLQPVNVATMEDGAAAGSLVARTETVSVDAGGAAGTITIVRRAGIRDIGLRLALPAGVTAQVAYDPSRVALGALRGIETTAGSVTVRDGLLELTGTGVQGCTLEVIPRAAGASVSVALMAGTHQVFSRVIPLEE
ncbi:MAG: hypothetical protein AB1428_02470 [Bacteroidota bacterium]